MPLPSYAMEISGLPLHPLAVHAAVVLGPIGALTALAYAGLRRRRERLRRPMLVMALVTTGSVVVAYLSGGDLLASRPELRQNPQVEVHEQRAELLLWTTLTFGAVAGLAGLVHSRPGPLRAAVALALAVVSVGVLVMVVLTGEAGARAVWGGPS